ncbi:MAG: hypothetical protein KC423_24195 [Anaerolineales bacterium]|nr:hypothetical protein [Anaerolineales bacterium]
MMIQKHSILQFLALLSLVFILAACGGSNESSALPTPIPESNDASSQADTQSVAAPSAAENPTTTDGYPAPEQAQPPAAYPVEGLQAEPPNPERQLPAAGADVGVVGGVLIRELTDQGFMPLNPQKLMLGEIVQTNSGEAAYVSVDDQNSPQAEMFPTGVFIFRNVAPGTYGLVVDLGFTQFLVNQPDGSQFVFTVEPGQALDLGQVITQTTN